MVPGCEWCNFVAFHKCKLLLSVQCGCRYYVAGAMTPWWQLWYLPGKLDGSYEKMAVCAFLTRINARIVQAVPSWQLWWQHGGQGGQRQKIARRLHFSSFSNFYTLAVLAIVIKAHFCFVDCMLPPVSYDRVWQIFHTYLPCKHICKHGGRWNLLMLGKLDGAILAFANFAFLTWLFWKFTLELIDSDCELDMDLVEVPQPLNGLKAKH